MNITFMLHGWTIWFYLITFLIKWCLSVSWNAWWYILSEVAHLVVNHMLAFMKIPEKQKKYEHFWKQNKTRRIFFVKLMKKGCLPCNLCFFWLGDQIRFTWSFVFLSLNCLVDNFLLKATPKSPGVLKPAISLVTKQLGVVSFPSDEL